jgi:hypothetical protein
VAVQSGRASDASRVAVVDAADVRGDGVRSCVTHGITPSSCIAVPMCASRCDAKKATRETMRRAGAADAARAPREYRAFRGGLEFQVFCQRSAEGPVNCACRQVLHEPSRSCSECGCPNSGVGAIRGPTATE